MGSRVFFCIDEEISTGMATWLQLYGDFPFWHCVAYVPFLFEESLGGKDENFHRQKGEPTRPTLDWKSFGWERKLQNPSFK